MNFIQSYARIQTFNSKKHKGRSNIALYKFIFRKKREREREAESELAVRRERERLSWPSEERERG